MVSEPLHGFDTTELTHNNEANSTKEKASAFFESSSKKRLFLLSNSKDTNNDRAIGSSAIANKLKRIRKKVTYEEVFEMNGKKYRVNSAKSGLYIEILSRIIQQFELAVQKWGRVFTLRFDLHSQQYDVDNSRITKFRKRLFQRLKRAYGFKQIGFCWVREQERSKAQHYHWVLFVDGSLIRHSSRINLIIKNCWECDSPNNHVPVIKRPFYFGTMIEIGEEVIFRISYLAKARGKGRRRDQVKDYQTSRMK